VQKHRGAIAAAGGRGECPSPNRPDFRFSLRNPNGVKAVPLTGQRFQQRFDLEVEVGKYNLLLI
jgi:hypothetical protein